MPNMMERLKALEDFVDQCDELDLGEMKNVGEHLCGRLCRVEDMLGMYQNPEKPKRKRKPKPEPIATAQ